jgi:hypothetical protein
MEHDPDDPPNQDPDNWWFLNRWAEETLRWLRIFNLI